MVALERFICPQAHKGWKGYTLTPLVLHLYIVIELFITLQWPLRSPNITMSMSLA